MFMTIETEMKQKIPFNFIVTSLLGCVWTCDVNRRVIVFKFNWVE